MTSEYDAIRRALACYGMWGLPSPDKVEAICVEARAQLDALLAENARLREALSEDRTLRMLVAWARTDEDGRFHTLCEAEDNADTYLRKGFPSREQAEALLAREEALGGALRTLIERIRAVAEFHDDAAEMHDGEVPAWDLTQLAITEAEALLAPEEPHAS